MASGGKVCLFSSIIDVVAHEVLFFTHFCKKFLEKETHDFASQMFPPGFFMVHDATRGCHNNVTVKEGIQKLKLSLQKNIFIVRPTKNIRPIIGNHRNYHGLSSVLSSLD